MLGLIGDRSLAESLMVERNIKFNYSEGKIICNNEGNKKIRKKVVSASDLFDSDDEIAKKYDNESTVTNKLTNFSSELSVDIIRDTERLTRTINSILANPKNWIVSEIKKEDYKVIRVELKPLDIAPYCKFVFGKASKTLIMSATILNHKSFCRSVGINPDEVKYIQIQSDFPIENRPIYPLDIAYLNYSNLQSSDVISRIAKTVDNLMFVHKNDKGIIHTSSYEQLNFIKENISQENARRLLVTDPDIQRDEILFQHMSTPKPTVLISPSLHTGLDLKDNLSRFQIITKVPYPNKSDRWINAKRKEDEEWYYWQTAIKLIQAYGRSVRSKEDWAKTYVLDSAFGYFVKKNRNILPNWFINAIKSRFR
jgi:Rad3-related DNA helicase